MSTAIVVAEGKMDLAMARRLCRTTGKKMAAISFRDAHGGGNFWAEARNYNAAASKGISVFGLADLERLPCATRAFNKYLGGPPASKFCLRLAVPMLESWLMGDAVSLRTFFCLSKNEKIPATPESLKHPKKVLLEILSKTQRDGLGKALAVYENGSWWPGPEYTSNITDFIGRVWNVRQAAIVCPSLSRAIAALRTN
jgi:hypothetical protein